MVMEFWRHAADNYNVVKVSQLRLRFGTTLLGAANDEVIAIQITGKATKKGKVSSSSSSSSSSIRTQKLGFTNSKAPTAVVWNARDLCDFHLVLKHASVTGTCHLTLHVLHGKGDVGEYKPEMVVVGEVSMSFTMAELMMKNESNSCEVQRTLPIQLKVHGFFMEATLSVSLSLLKLKNFHDDLPRASFVNKVTSHVEKNDGEVVDQVEQCSSYESDELSVFDSDDSSDESNTTTSSSSNSSSTRERSMDLDSETLLETMQRSWSMLPWNRSFKEWSFKRTSSRKQEPLISNSTHSMGPYFEHNSCNASGWETRELRSRDGQSKLKTNVFFASFDQRSKKACGESACSTLAVFIAHWLHSNHDNMPTRAQFDSLIKRGSSEWRRLSKVNHYQKLFPDKHFDLETILEANIRPLVVHPRNSYTGFFSPERFHGLEGAMSFDDIWDEINDDVVDDHEPRVYIVSWNDHFFVVKVEVNACYVIDTFGERLYEGCKKAFILKFDGSSLMHKNGSKKEKGEIVCNGKECCKEFIKRFLAAIPVRQLEEEEQNKGSVYNPYFHRKLQIDFHYSLLSSL